MSDKIDEGQHSCSRFDNLGPSHCYDGPFVKTPGERTREQIRAICDDLKRRKPSAEAETVYEIAAAFVGLLEELRK